LITANKCHNAAYVSILICGLYSNRGENRIFALLSSTLQTIVIRKKEKGDENVGKNDIEYLYEKIKNVKNKQTFKVGKSVIEKKCQEKINIKMSREEPALINPKQSQVATRINQTYQTQGALPASPALTSSNQL
jgi:hypothetical protein